MAISNLSNDFAPDPDSIYPGYYLAIFGTPIDNSDYKLSKVGVAESEYKFVISMSCDRPLNPPILGDFPFSVPPKVGGLGGQKPISNQQRPKVYYIYPDGYFLDEDDFLADSP
ncbi:MAG: hypothetical protein DCF12_18445 [Snowella sp.]|nr:MAG: hypothetical protein DCF12_18445 [Snowella sp.]